MGRPNVGKSALFNRLAGRPLALVDPRPGVTRDRLETTCEWAGTAFRLVDTGGFDPSDRSLIQAQVAEQATAAVRAADLVMLCVDARQGITPADEEAAGWVRRLGRPVLVVANKADSAAGELAAWEAARLGFGDPAVVSAIHGRNVGDLLDAVVARLQIGPAPEAPPALRLAIVGRPNVGKSTLANRLAGEARVVTDAEPGTTRDVVAVPARLGDHPVLLLDTAGLRRPDRVDDPLERAMVRAALAALRQADVVLFVVDATARLTEQDQRVAGRVRRSGRAAVVVANKCDLLPGGWSEEFSAHIGERITALPYAVVCGISAATGRGLGSLAAAVETAAASFTRQLDPSSLAAVVARAVREVPPPGWRGRQTVIGRARQVGSRPPVIALPLSDRRALHFSYLRYLEATVRRHFDCRGTPILWRRTS